MGPLFADSPCFRHNIKYNDKFKGTKHKLSRDISNLQLNNMETSLIRTFLLGPKRSGLERFHCVYYFHCVHFVAKEICLTMFLYNAHPFYIMPTPGLLHTPVSQTQASVCEWGTTSVTWSSSLTPKSTSWAWTLNSPTLTTRRPSCLRHVSTGWPQQVGGGCVMVCSCVYIHVCIFIRVCAYVRFINFASCWIWTFLNSFHNIQWNLS